MFQIIDIIHLGIKRGGPPWIGQNYPLPCQNRPSPSSPRPSRIYLYETSIPSTLRYMTTFMFSHQPCRRLPPKSCTYNNKMIQCPHLLKKICFDPHTIFSHPYHKTKICFIQSASTISPITSKVLNKQQQNESRMFPHLLMICFGSNTIITHPDKKQKVCFVQSTSTISLSPIKTKNILTTKNKMRILSTSPHGNMLQSPSPSPLILMRNIKSTSFSPHQPYPRPSRRLPQKHVLTTTNESNNTTISMRDVVCFA